MSAKKKRKAVGSVSRKSSPNRHRAYVTRHLAQQEKLFRAYSKKLKEAEKKFQTVFDHSAVGITVTDSKEKIIQCNPFILQLLGMEKSDLIGKPVKNIYPAEEWNRIRVYNIHHHGVRRHFETKVISRHGRLIDVTIAFRVLTDTRGKGVGSIGFIRDISERKKLERIRQEFVGVISHELRTPLVPMKEGVSQVLEGLFGEINDDQREYLTIVYNETNRLKRIIDDLLDIFKFEIDKYPMKKDLVDMKSLIKGVVATFSPQAQAKGLTIKMEIPQHPILLYADRDRINQVLANLLSNAVKFAEKGSIKVSAAIKRRTVECHVVDTGEGMAKKHVALLFTKFQQFRKSVNPEERGSGLGLVICKNIIELHKGKIWAKSSVKKGTTLSFTLPLYSSRALFKELIADNLKDAIEDDSSFSIIAFGIRGVNGIVRTIGKDKVASVIETLELLIRNILRRSKDLSLRYRGNILTILPNTANDGASAVAERINTAFNEYSAQMELVVPITLSWRVVNFPADADTVETLFKKIDSTVH